MFSYSTGYYVSRPDDQYLKFKNRCSLMHTPMQIVFLNNFKIVGPLSKMKPCTGRGPKIGKKTLESCDVQTFDNQVNAFVGAHMKE